MDICQQCLEELFDPGNRRYLYPFINCTNCGPRYSLIDDLPYDRQKTSMKVFDLCRHCSDEYHNPTNRRFHAQPNACPQCGPQLQLLSNTGTIEKTIHPIETVQQLLGQGHIIAIKGIGGFHLAVNAANSAAIALLRARKGRPDKPLAVMSKDIQTVQHYAALSKPEQDLLLSHQKPIVLLEKKEPFPLPAALAPDNKYIGVLLPYSPLHHLLFHNAPYSSLVMTSANLSGEPIVINTSQALNKLSDTADYFLVHNREIRTSNDDSVLFTGKEQPVFIRRSRSYAPAPISLAFDAGTTLAVGSALKNTLCFTKGCHYFLSQHIGNLQQYETTQHFDSVVHHLQDLLLAKPDLIVHDMHPDYYATRFALSSELPSVAVQHHHAHAVSCMAENNLNGPVIAVVLDGTGLGPDKTIWGGEILTATHHDFTRSAHFEAIPLPGGDAAVKEPWRMALSYLLHAFQGKIPSLDLAFLEKHHDKITLLSQMISQQINTPLTSSCGRLFDAVAALIGVRDTITFEGQAAIQLEMIAAQQTFPAYSYRIATSQDSSLTISFAQTFAEIIDDLSHKISTAVISRRFHETIASAISHTCQKIRARNGINDIVLSGGVFQNRLLLDRLPQLLRSNNFLVYTHRQIPANDGGLCLGQALAGRSTHRMQTK